MRHFYCAALLLDICNWSVLRAELDYAVDAATREECICSTSGDPAMLLGVGQY